MKHPHLLGTGTLTWNADERRSDRYGSVYLIPNGHNSFTKEPSPSLVDENAVRSFEGQRGELIAVVKATRESTHIGDLFHGISPRTPEVGQIIVLGNGTLFCDHIFDGGIAVGLRPDDGRVTQWLNMRALYDAHEQTVELIFCPSKE